MRERSPLFRASAAAIEGLESRLFLSASVLNYRYDSGSDGLNTAETLLTPTNVNTTTFAKAFTVPVDGQVYAEPLVAAGVTIKTGVNTTSGAAGVHDVVFVATENDSVYAISSGSGGGQILWQRSLLSTTNSGGNVNNTLGATSISTLVKADVISGDITPVVGITGTPVIDGSAGILYLVAKTKEVVGGVTYYVQRVHGLKLSDGTDAAAPYLLGTTTNGNTNQTQIYAYGTGDGHVTDPYNNTGKQVVQFNALRENERTAISLVNGNLYLSFASHGDNGPYHGWIVMLSTTTLSTAGFKLDGVFCSSPNNGEAGIWQGGGALAFEKDFSSFYFMTGNGSGGAPTLNASGFPTGANYNEAVVKAQLDTTTTATSQGANGWGIKVVDYFIPYNVAAMDNADSDFGSGAPLILPASAGITNHPNLLIAGGKDGRVYVLDRSNLGLYNATNDAALNSVANSTGNLTPPSAIGGTLSTPTYFNGKLYLASGYSNYAKQFTISSTGKLMAGSQTALSSLGSLAGGPIVSAQGTSNGIVWLMDRNSNEIHAYDANTLATELWNSNDVSTDNLGAVVKFAEPTVVNGQVFVGTSNSLVVYGLNNTPTKVPNAPVLSATALSGSSINLTWTDSTVSPNKPTVYLIDESSSGGAYTQVATAPAGATSIAIGALQPLSTYSFKIAGMNSVGQSLFSNIASATTTNQASGIDYSSGFAGESQMTLNKDVTLKGSDLTLTDGGVNEDSSAFYNSLVSVTSFSSQFQFQITAGTGTADGFTFALQNVGPTALGPGGGGLGYGPSSTTGTGGIPNSVAVKFDLYSNHGEGMNSTGLFTDGASPTGTSSIDLTPSGLDLHSGDLFQVNLAYDGTKLTEIIKDTKTAKSVTETYTINIPAIVGSNTAYAGFTGGTGSKTATQNILNFSYSPSATISPNTPSGLGATPAKATSVNLVWTNNATNQTGYFLDRATDSGFTQNLVTEALPASPASFTDSLTGLAPGNTYYYRLRATNSAGASGNSNVATVTIPLAPPKPTNQLIAADGSNEIDITWQDNAGHLATGYTILRAVNHGSFAVVADLPPTSRPAPSQYGWSDTTVTPGNLYEYHIEAVNTSGNNDFAGLSATTPPAGWTDSDIGSPALVGSALDNSGTWTVAGNGTDIWNTADQFNFAYETRTGDSMLIADVTSQTNSNAWAKAGVMIRASSDANAAFVDVIVASNGTVALQWRSTAGAKAVAVDLPGNAAARWVKLVRTGNSFGGYYSSDGVKWTQIGTAQTVQLSTTALAGLAVSSHNTAALSTATFTGVSVT